HSVCRLSHAGKPLGADHHRAARQGETQCLVGVARSPIVARDQISFAEGFESSTNTCPAVCSFVAGKFVTLLSATPDRNRIYGMTHDRRRQNEVRAGMTDTRVRAAMVDLIRWQLPDVVFRPSIANRPHD